MTHIQDASYESESLNLSTILLLICVGLVKVTIKKLLLLLFQSFFKLLLNSPVQHHFKDPHVADSDESTVTRAARIISRMEAGRTGAERG